MFTFLKNHFINRALSYSNKQRTVTYPSLQTINKIAFISNINEKASIDMVVLFKKQFSKLNIQYNEIKIDLFSDEKGISNSEEKNIISLNRSNLNWFEKPDDNIIKPFIDNQFDILINCTTESCFAINYIELKSNAFFKIGVYTPTEKYHDLSISNTTEDQLSPQEFVKQVNHYITSIKSI